jgi:hypothetical protein
MYRADVRTVNLQGNPVRAVLTGLRDQNLLYIDSSRMTSRAWPPAFLNPDPAWHLVRRAPVSTMIVPPVEESL